MIGITESHTILQCVLHHETFRIKAEVINLSEFLLHARAEVSKYFCVLGIFGEVTDLVWVSLHIKELLRRSTLMKLYLRSIQLAGFGQFTPFGVGEHLVAVIIL